MHCYQCCSNRNLNLKQIWLIQKYQLVLLVDWVRDGNTSIVSILNNSQQTKLPQTSSPCDRFDLPTNDYRIGDNASLQIWVSFGFWPRRLVWPCFINFLTSNPLLCPFHKKLLICEMSMVFCQTDNPRFSFIMYCYWTVSSVYSVSQ